MRPRRPPRREARRVRPAPLAIPELAPADSDPSAFESREVLARRELSLLAAISPAMAKRSCAGDGRRRAGSVNEPVAYESEDRRSAFRAGVGPERELAVVRKGRREFTVWIRNVSSGGIGFACDRASTFRTDDKIVVVTSSGTFEGRVAHVTPAEHGIHLVGVQRVRILEELHAQIVERGDLPRSPVWIKSLIWWTAASVAICAGTFYLERSGSLETFGIRSSHAASVDSASAVDFEICDVASRFRTIESLLDHDERVRLGLSARQELHVVDVAERTAIRVAELFVDPSAVERAELVRKGEAAIDEAERRIDELLEPDQRDRWRRSSSRTAGR